MTWPCFLQFYFIILNFYSIVRISIIKKQGRLKFLQSCIGQKLFKLNIPPIMFLTKDLNTNWIRVCVCCFFYYDSKVKDLFKKMSTTEATKYVHDCTCALVNIVSPVITFLLKYNHQHIIMKRICMFCDTFLKNLFNLFSHRK